MASFPVYRVRKEFNGGKIRALHGNLLLPSMCISDNAVDSNDRFYCRVDITGKSVKQIQNAEASQTRDSQYVFKATEHSAKFSVFDSEFSDANVFKCIHNSVKNLKMILNL